VNGSTAKQTKIISVLSCCKVLCPLRRSSLSSSSCFRCQQTRDPLSENFKEKTYKYIHLATPLTFVHLIEKSRLFCCGLLIFVGLGSCFGCEPDLCLFSSRREPSCFLLFLSYLIPNRMSSVVDCRILAIKINLIQKGNDDDDNTRPRSTISVSPFIYSLISCG
jgi:hypothetical protein